MQPRHRPVCPANDPARDAKAPTMRCDSRSAGESSWTVAPHRPAGGVFERLVDRPIDVDGSPRITSGAQELFDSGRRLRSVDRQALQECILAGTFVLVDKRRVVPRDKFGSNVWRRQALAPLFLPRLQFADATRQSPAHGSAIQIASVFLGRFDTRPMLDSRVVTRPT
jgi:hypothetical protein